MWFFRYYPRNIQNHGASEVFWKNCKENLFFFHFWLKNLYFHRFQHIVRILYANMATSWWGWGGGVCMLLTSNNPIFICFSNIGFEFFPRKQLIWIVYNDSILIFSIKFRVISMNKKHYNCRNVWFIARNRAVWMRH